jgi:hypothetical protein
VALLFFGDLPAARRFLRYGAVQRQLDGGVGIQNDVAALNQLIQIRAHCGEMVGRLCVFAHRQTRYRKALRNTRHLIRVIINAAH